MAKLLLLSNPIKRRRAKKKSHGRKKRRSAKQIAATKRMLAAAKAARRAKSGHKSKAKKHRRRARRSHVSVGAASRATHKAPSKRLRRRRSKNHVKGYYPNPLKGASMAKRKHHRRRSARRHNPISIKGALSRPMGVLKPALQGAAGALAVNGLINYVPGIPDSLKTGNMLHVTKAVLALALGTFGPKLPGLGKHAAKMAEGALTVVATDVAKQVAMNQFNFNLSGVGFVNPARVVSSTQNVRSLSMYTRGVGGLARTGMYVSSGR